jgi:hypothetical protein
VISAPSIWVPRRDLLLPGRRFLELFTTGKAQRNPSTGRIKSNASARLLRNTTATTCCCTCAGCTTGTVPTSWTLSASGITTNYSTCLDNFAAIPYEGFFPDPNMSGITLTFVSGSSTSCVWQYVVSDPSYGITQYNDPNCTSQRGTFCTGQAAWILTRSSAGSFGLTFGCTNGGGGPFLASAVTTAGCNPTSLTMTNAATTHSSGTGFWGCGNSGTAVLTPNP